MDWNTLTLPNSQFNKDLDAVYMSSLLRMQGMPLLHKSLGTNKNISGRGYIKEQVMAGNALFEEVAEGAQEAPLFNPREVTNWTVKVKLYKRGIKVTREAVDDDFKNWIPKWVEQLADSSVYTVERDFVDRNFNNGFTYDASRDKRDSKALYATDHPVGLDGGTIANAAGTPANLSESTLADAIASFTYTKNDDGFWVPTQITSFTLVVHASRVPYANQIVKSMSSMTAQANSGVRNLISDYTITVTTSPFLTGVNRWFLIANPIQGTTSDQTIEGTGTTGMVLLWKDMYALEQKVEQDPDVKKWIGRYRMTQYISDFRSAYGNNAS